MKCLFNDQGPGDLARDAGEEACSHADCMAAMQQKLQSDIYNGSRLLIASSHYPCPRSLKRNQTNLRFLLTCHQVYQEARTIPYSQSTFHVQDIGSFANFTFCLKSWQVRSLAHLTFDISTRRGMETHGAEWNETFSLIGLSFLGVSTISLNITVAWTEICFKNVFWDGGLLELDRLKLKGIKLVIWRTNPEGHSKIYFSYSAGSLSLSRGANSFAVLPSPSDHPISFRHARDAL